jgi:hypothetical protein
LNPFKSKTTKSSVIIHLLQKTKATFPSKCSKASCVPTPKTVSKTKSTLPTVSSPTKSSPDNKNSKKSKTSNLYSFPLP